jgi:pyruvate/2-oxoglutarate dehydrogenase complex dihydrolipoamide dehydrogenase (E3) component
MIGAETAEFLAEQNNRVTIVEMLPGIALDMEALNRKGLMDALKEKGIEMLTGREVVEISPKGVIAIDKDSGEQQLIEAEWVVLAMGAKPAETLANALEGKVPELYRAGDCREARTIMAAIYEGAASALEI